VGIVVSLMLVGAGAILVWAVTGEVTGVDLDAVGVILMIVGILSLFLTLVFWSSWWGAGAWRRRAYVADDPGARPAEPASRRRTVVEEEEGGPPGPPGPPPP
jgi:uncharacterized protein DUF6458